MLNGNFFLSRYTKNLLLSLLVVRSYGRFDSARKKHIDHLTFTPSTWISLAPLPFLFFSLAPRTDENEKTKQKKMVQNHSANGITSVLGFPNENIDSILKLSCRLVYHEYMRKQKNVYNNWNLFMIAVTINHSVHMSWENRKKNHNYRELFSSLYKIYTSSSILVFHRVYYIWYIRSSQHSYRIIIIINLTGDTEISIRVVHIR